MGVKGIDFDYVSMIFQLDFGIVSLMIKNKDGGKT
jgi:hypothetical protein